VKRMVRSSPHCRSRFCLGVAPKFGAISAWRSTFPVVVDSPPPEEEFNLNSLNKSTNLKFLLPNLIFFTKFTFFEKVDIFTKNEITFFHAAITFFTLDAAA
jgi:hypothetical protein